MRCLSIFRDRRGLKVTDDNTIRKLFPEIGEIKDQCACLKPARTITSSATLGIRYSYENLQRKISDLNLAAFHTIFVK